MTARRGGSRAQFAVFITHTILVQAITYAVRPTATYRALELDVPTAWLGAVAASYALVPLLLAVPSGQAVDRLGERKVMVAGAVLMSVSGLGFLFMADALPGLVLATIGLGVGHLFSVVGQQAMVANRIPRERYDTAFGHYTFVASLGQAVGPGLIVVLGGNGSIPETSEIFAGALVLSLVLLAMALLLEGGVPRSSDDPEPNGTMRTLVKTPGVARALVVSSIVLAAVDIMLVYLPALGTERAIAATAVGTLLALRAAASMVSRLFLGVLSTTFGRRNLLITSVVMAAVGLLVLPIRMPVWGMGIVVSLLGLGLGAGQPLTMSWLAEAAPPGLRGRAMSLRLTGNRLGQVVVPSLAGIVAIGAGAGGVLALTGMGLTAAGVAARGLSATSERRPT